MKILLSLFRLFACLIIIAVLEKVASRKTYYFQKLPFKAHKELCKARLPPGAFLKFDLLDNHQPGLNYGRAPHLGAFVPQNWAPGLTNRELQDYTAEAATQDLTSNAITITSTKDSSTGRVTSARLDTYRIWSTSLGTKFRGYLEVDSTMPVSSVDNWSFKGSWPAIWMVGSGNGTKKDWPKNGEIDIVEAVNGQPKIHLSLHSTHFNGARAQHPELHPIRVNADLVNAPLKAGFEWKVEQDKIDMIWHLSWLDQGSRSWVATDTSKTLYRNSSLDFGDFFNSFSGNGFSLIINLAQGGKFPRVTRVENVLRDGQPQYMHITSAKVFGFI